MINLTESIREIKKYLDLADVMEFYGVEFTSKTGDAWKARCFNHVEKVPSLTISPRKGLFTCFSTGCGVGGDVISFVQAIQNLSPHDAAVSLATEFGIDISQFTAQDEKGKATARLYKYSGQLADRFNECLFKSKEAKSYLIKRGVNAETAKAFQIGWCPSTDFALKAAQSIGATDGEAKALGLTSRQQFGDTITFPIYRDGKVATFYSKALRRTDPEAPKYFGPRGDHPLRSGGGMFGLQVARRCARKRGGLILVEGFFDALVLHTKGFTNTVCMLGSSPRPEQMQVLSNIHIPSVTVLFDNDRAGEAGALKAIESRAGDMGLKVAFLPDGDPDEYVLKHGEEAMASILEQSVSASQYLLGIMVDRIMAGDLGDRARSIKELSVLATKLPRHESALLYVEMSKMTGISVEELKDEVTTTVSPKSVESELTVLAACVRDELCLMEAEGKLSNKLVWSLGRHKAVWDCIIDLKKKKVTDFSEAVLKEHIKEEYHATIQSISGRDYSNFEFHLDQVHESYMRRTLQKAGETLSFRATDKSRDVPGVLSDHLSALSNNVAGDSSTEFDAPRQVEIAMDYIHERMANADSIPGIDLGNDWKNFTLASLGLQNSYMYMLSALPKSCKTTTAMCWAAETAIEKKRPTLWLNFEMGEKDLALRFLSIISGLPNMRLRMGGLAASEKETLNKAAVKYHASPLHVVNCSGMNLAEVVGIMRKYVYSHGIEAIFLDYIQLIQHGNSKLSYWERHMDISTQLKSTINTLSVPLVAISQLSKAGIEGGGALHMGGSFKYLQDCDMAMELRRRKREEFEADPNGTHLLNIDFNRHGPMEVSIKLLFDSQSLRIREAE